MKAVSEKETAPPETCECEMEGTGWGTRSPLPGVLIITRGDTGLDEIQRCDCCGKYESDDDAADAFFKEFLRRGG